jgi:hypothetical protein
MSKKGTTYQSYSRNKQEKKNANKRENDKRRSENESIPIPLSNDEYIVIIHEYKGGHVVRGLFSGGNVENILISKKNHRLFFKTKKMNNDEREKKNTNNSNNYDDNIFNEVIKNDYLLVKHSSIPINGSTNYFIEYVYTNKDIITIFKNYSNEKWYLSTWKTLLNDNDDNYFYTINNNNELDDNLDSDDINNI